MVLGLSTIARPARAKAEPSVRAACEEVWMFVDPLGRFDEKGLAGLFRVDNRRDRRADLMVVEMSSGSR
jgi:hypothetical protein